jgi:serine/threonine protein kinase/Tol biopolymer transport system component
LQDRYRVERELGAGGMATVYLAHDLKHGRRVALKVLHPELGAVLGIDRFLAEIRTTANLQHPNILQLFDSGSADGLVYYTMPYVEGESLRQRLERERQLPLSDAVAIARGVAAALDYAHRHGVIHRDIKPENILLQDGQPLVADFGIALAVKQAGGARLTQTGLSLGTPQYMSPEQATAERELDPRSDVYSLGAVLYELLAGEPPFSGASTQAVIARLMTEEPRPLGLTRRSVPPAVEAAVHRALEKLPADRFSTAAQFADALVNDEASRVFRPVRRTTGWPGSSRVPLIAMAAVTLVALIMAAWSLSRRPAERPRPVVRFELTPPPDWRSMDVTSGSPLALSPDGSTLVYVGANGGGRPRQLYRWNLAEPQPTPLAGTESSGFPFFSPDGEWVAFLVGGQLRRTSVRGGGSVAIGEVAAGITTFRGGTWTSRGEIVLASTNGLLRMPADGGTVTPLPLADSIRNGRQQIARPVVALWPDALPGGEWILVALVDRSGVNQVEIAVVSLQGEVRRLGVNGSNPRYVEPGYLLFTNVEGALMAASFDVRRRRVTGAPQPVAEGISIGSFSGGKLAVSRWGTVAYLEGPATGRRRLVRVDRQGRETVLDAPLRSYSGPRLSPDGSRVAVALGAAPQPPNDIWLYHLTLGTLTRVTFDSTSLHPEWSADGRRLYHRRALGGFTVMATTPDGSAPPESLYSTTGDLWEVVPTRSGDTLIIRELRSAENDRDIWLVSLRQGGSPVPVATGPRIQAEAALSPDGRWITYSSDESGAFEVYVKAFPGPGPRYQVSNEGGLAPRWNPEGGELFFISRDSLVALPARTEGAVLRLGRGQRLFPFRYALIPYHANYDVAPDGSWFMTVATEAGPESRGFRMVLNWFDHRSE